MWDSKLSIDEESLTSSFNQEVIRLTRALMNRAVLEKKLNLIDITLEVSYEYLMEADIRTFDKQ